MGQTLGPAPSLGQGGKVEVKPAPLPRQPNPPNVLWGSVTSSLPGAPELNLGCGPKALVEPPVLTS